MITVTVGFLYRHFQNALCDLIAMIYVLNGRKDCLLDVWNPYDLLEIEQTSACASWHITYLLSIVYC